MPDEKKGLLQKMKDYKELIVIAMFFGWLAFTVVDKYRASEQLPQLIENNTEAINAVREAIETSNKAYASQKRDIKNLRSAVSILIQEVAEDNPGMVKVFGALLNAEEDIP